MGVQQKPEEEAMPVEKPIAQEEKSEAKPPYDPSILISVDLHCIGCAQKIERYLLQIRGVVGVGTDMVKNQVRIKGVVEPEAVCNMIMKKTKKSAKVLSPHVVVTSAAAESEPIPQLVVASQVTRLITVELSVNMHCEACAEQLKHKILKMKGVSKVETELISGKVNVIGSMDGEKLVEYVYKHTKKQAKIVVPQPKKEKEEDKGVKDAETEEKKDESEDAKAEERMKEGGEDEKAEKKEGIDEKLEGGGCGGDDDEDEEKYMQQRMMYYYQQQQSLYYVMERIPAPQLFSDDNPNACTIC